VILEDDAFRCLLSLGEFSNATTENVIKVFEDAESYAMSFNGASLPLTVTGIPSSMRTSVIRRDLPGILGFTWIQKISNTPTSEEVILRQMKR
jgi:hypothetical protein